MSSTTKDSTNNNALGLSSPALTYTIRIAAIVFIAEALEKANKKEIIVEH